MQNKCLRIVTGAFKATPLPELHHEAGVQPLDITMDSQVLAYQLSHIDTPASKTIEKECRRIRNLHWRANRTRDQKPTTHVSKREWAKKEMERNLGGNRQWTTASKEEKERCVAEFREREGETRWKRYQEQGGRHGSPAQRTPWNAKIDYWHKGLTKAQSSIAVQVRTEKIGLKAFLFKQRVPEVEGPHCQCNHGEQTAKHIITYCPKYSERRSLIQRALGTTDYNEMIASNKGLKAITAWIIHMGILHQFSRAAELLSKTTPTNQR